MTLATHDLNFKGNLLARGFWLYVWEVTPPEGTKLYYVGRTGDSSSINAQSPFNRMGQHLGFAKNSNMLRRYLVAEYIDPERCSFRMAAYGPILEEAKARDLRCERRDMVAALEKALAEAMRDAGYKVMNTVKCKKALDKNLFKQVRAVFVTCFPDLRSL